MDSRLGNRYDLNTEEQNNRHNCQNNIAEKNNQVNFDNQIAPQFVYFCGNNSITVS